MTLKAFLFLFVVTMVAVVGSALIAEMLVPPGFERGIIIAVLSGLVVFPAARWAEYRGWIKGSWSPGGDLRMQRDARREEEAREARAARQASQQGHEEQASLPADTSRDQPTAAAGRDPRVSRAGDNPSPGDPR